MKIKILNNDNIIECNIENVHILSDYLQSQSIAFDELSNVDKSNLMIRILEKEEHFNKLLSLKDLQIPESRKRLLLQNGHTRETACFCTDLLDYAFIKQEGVMLPDDKLQGYRTGIIDITIIKAFNLS